MQITKLNTADGRLDIEMDNGVRIDMTDHHLIIDGVEVDQILLKRCSAEKHIELYECSAEGRIVMDRCREGRKFRHPSDPTEQS